MVTYEGNLFPLGKATPGAFAQNVSFFASDLGTKFDDIKGTVWLLHVELAAAANLQYTVDGHATWHKLDVGTILTGDYAILRYPGGKFNLRCSDVAGCTVDNCQLLEDGNE